MKPSARVTLPVISLAIALSALAQSASAQEPTMGAGTWPTQWPLAPNPQLASSTLLLGEPTNGAGLSPWVASVPLRLSLSQGMFPLAHFFPNCASREGASGNSFNGWPVQRYTLLPLTSNLVLHGFSSAGCPVDGAIGGGVTYAQPLGKPWWLVAGAGVYGRSGFNGVPSRTRGDVRVDLVNARPDGRSVSVGIGRRGVSIGGTW
jgi:hypothetical protein